MIKNLKEKAIGATGSVSGVAGVLGSWQICHNVCLGLIAVAGVLGITVVGMPLEFLTRIAVPIWIVATVILAITYGLYYYKPCISSRLLLINTGLIVAGMPFAPQSFMPFFWVAGGGIGATGVGLYIKDKVKS